MFFTFCLYQRNRLFRSSHLTTSLFFCSIFAKLKIAII
nr:MAG TPA: hypothetical protein [Caudoviricetes sp.]